MIKPEIIIEDRINFEKEVKKEISFNPYKKKRKNNRKNTRGRKSQIIEYMIGYTFPPIFKTKIIKH
jgi:hypothetical protein